MRTKIPLIDTTKLLSLDLKSTEPLMDALLSPTTLEARLRQTTRTINDDFKDATKYSMTFQKQVDDLAEEAEGVGTIGPIILPDVDSSGTENPNKVGWVDEHFLEEMKEEKARKRAIEEVRKRREKLIAKLKQKSPAAVAHQHQHQRQESFGKPVGVTSSLSMLSSDDNNTVFSSNRGAPPPLGLARDETRVGDAAFRHSRTASEAAVSAPWMMTGNGNTNGEDDRQSIAMIDDEDVDEGDYYEDEEYERGSSPNHDRKNTVRYRGSAAASAKQSRKGTFVTANRRQSTFSVNSTPASTSGGATGHLLSTPPRPQPVRAEHTGIYPTTPATSNTKSSHLHASPPQRSITGLGNSNAEASPPFLSSGEMTKQDRRRSSVVFDSALLTESDEHATRSSVLASDDQHLLPHHHSGSVLLQNNNNDSNNSNNKVAPLDVSYESQKATRRKLSTNGYDNNNNNGIIVDSAESVDGDFNEENVIDNDDNDDEKEKEMARNREDRSELEKAQMEVVQQIRFVQPRSVAPSQFGDLVEKISSISKTVDKDDLEVPLHPKETDREKCKMNLSELLQQQKKLITKLESDRPGYESMMEKTEELLKTQRDELEKRYAVIS